MKGYRSLTIAYEIAKILGAEIKDLSMLKLTKLVYISHGYMLGKHGRPLIRDEIRAWEYGPAIPDLYHQLKGFGRSHIEISDLKRLLAENGIAEEVAREARLVLKKVCEKYKLLGAWELSALTHLRGSPWHKVYYNPASSAVIDNANIQNYYSEAMRRDRYLS